MEPKKCHDNLAPDKVKEGILAKMFSKWGQLSRAPKFLSEYFSLLQCPLNPIPIIFLAAF